MAKTQILAVSDSSLSAIRRSIGIYKDETPIVGGRRRQAATAQTSRYEGMFAVSDGTDYTAEIPEYTVAVALGVVQVNRKFYDVAAVDIEVPIFATGEAPQWGWIVADFFLNPETLILGDPVWGIVENITTDFLAINYGRLVVGRVMVTVNPDTDRGQFDYIQDVYGVALCPIFGDCPEEEEVEP